MSWCHILGVWLMTRKLTVKWNGDVTFKNQLTDRSLSSTLIFCEEGEEIRLVNLFLNLLFSQGIYNLLFSSGFYPTLTPQDKKLVWCCQVVNLEVSLGHKHILWTVAASLHRFPICWISAALRILQTSFASFILRLFTHLVAVFKFGTLRIANFSSLNIKI